MIARNSPLIGFDRYVELNWCDSAFKVGTGQQELEQLRLLVATSLNGVESQRKTIDILKRLSINPFPQIKKFITHGLSLHANSNYSCTLPIAWGCAIAAYTFFGKTSETTGRLLSLQGDSSLKEVQRRMAEAYGDRNGVERAVSRILQSQENWGVIKKSADSSRLIKAEPIFISNIELTSWLIEAAVRFVGKPISVSNLQTTHVLYPFNFTQPLAYAASINTNLRIYSQGPSNQFVALADSLTSP